MPDDLSATSSYFSPRFPKSISEDNSTARGNAIGTKVQQAYIIKRATVIKPSPLPTRSSTYFHKNCSSRTKIAMKNVSTRGPRYCFNRKISNFLIRIILGLPNKKVEPGGVEPPSKQEAKKVSTRLFAD